MRFGDESVNLLLSFTNHANADLISWNEIDQKGVLKNRKHYDDCSLNISREQVLFVKDL